MKRKHLETSLSMLLLAVLMAASLLPAIITIKPVYAAETTGEQVQILFTHDLHSHLDPFKVDGEEA